MKLKIMLADIEETQCVKNQELTIIDNLLNSIFKSPFVFPKRCIKRTNEINVVEIGDFASDSQKMLNPVNYAKTLINLTFGSNYIIEVVQ